MIVKEQLLALPFDEGSTYAIGTTERGELIAIGIKETKEGSDVLVTLVGLIGPPVLLGSLARFNIPFELYDEPKRRARPNAHRNGARLDVDEFEVIGEQFDRFRVNTMTRETPLATAARMASIPIANLISEHNKGTLQPVLERVLRIDPFVSEPWLRPLARNWVAENVSLIKSIGQKHLTEVEHMIYRMVRGGESIKTIRAELEARFDITKNRARLIARDQVNKYNANLTEERQVRAGITKYIWHNVGGIRVRGMPGGLYAKAVPSHAVMEDVICRWDDPTVYWNGKRWVQRTALMEKQHPGEAIQCRCWAEGILDDI